MIDLDITAGVAFITYPAFGPLGTGGGPALPGTSDWASSGATVPRQGAFSA